MEISLTEVLVSLIGTAGTIIAAVAVALINQRIKDAQLRDVIANAAKNAVGIVQQGATGMVQRLDPRVPAGIVPDRLVPGVRYMLDHAGEAIERFGITPEKLAEKITAQIGLREIESNIAINASPAPVVVPPLAPSPPGTTASDLNRDQLDEINEELRRRGQ